MYIRIAENKARFAKSTPTETSLRMCMYLMKLIIGEENISCRASCTCSMPTSFKEVFCLKQQRQKKL